MSIHFADNLTPRARFEEDGLYELRCKNCGGALDPNTLKCGYCGSQYERKNQGGMTMYIQTCPAEVVPLAYQTRISYETQMKIPQEDLAKMYMREMTHRLAEALVPYMKIDVEKDIYTHERIIRGTVRVVEPDFRF